MIGYFNNKKVSMGYLGSTVIYRAEPAEEPLFIIGSDFISNNSRVFIALTRKNGKSGAVKVGEPFYKGDTLRVVLTDWAYKFRAVPSYNPEGSTRSKPFEIKTSNQEYSTMFPQGYSGGLSYSIVKA